MRDLRDLCISDARVGPSDYGYIASSVVAGWLHGWLQPQLPHETKIIACSAHSTASRGPSGTGPSSAIMADALTSVRAIRAADKVTYIDHFGGDSEGPVSTAVLARHIRYKGSTFSLSKLRGTHSVACAECAPREWHVWRPNAGTFWRASARPDYARTASCGNLNHLSRL